MQTNNAVSARASENYMGMFGDRDIWRNLVMNDHEHSHFGIGEARKRKVIKHHFHSTGN